MILLTNIVIFAGVYLGKRLVSQLKTPKSKISERQTSEIAIKNQALQHSKLGSSALLLSSAAYFYSPLLIVSAAVISYNTLPILQRSLTTLRQDKKVTIETYSTLMTTALLATSNYFAAAIQSTLYHFSVYLIAKNKTNSQHLTHIAYQQVPETVWIITNGVEQQIPLQQLLIGDQVVVNTGETIPIDGVVLTGKALINQQALTGETKIIEKTVDEEVMSTTIVLNGRLVIQASQSGNATRVHKLNTLLQQTTDYKTQLQLKGEAWANNMALPMITGTVALSPLIGINPALALLSSAPLNTVRSMLSIQTSAQLQWLTQQGVLIKDGRILEELPKIDTILFDKTGTLTESNPEVLQLIHCAEYDSNTLLSWAAAAEQHLEHPIAKAIVNHAQQRALALPDIQQSEYDLGLGVTVHINGHEVKVGSQRFIQSDMDTISLPTIIHTAMQESVGNTFVFIAIDGHIQAVIELHLRLRPEVPQMIAELRQRGIKQLLLVSGDDAAPTERLAEQLGLDQAFSKMLPPEKAELIQRLQTQGKHICFIGDGLNDAIALKQANISVCLSSATPIATEVAQVIMLKNNLNHFNALFDMAEQLQKRLGKNLYFWSAFGISNALAVPLLGFGPLQSSALFGLAFTSGLKLSQSVPANQKIQHNKLKSKIDCIDIRGTVINTT